MKSGVAKKRPKRRAYDNSLREKQALQTRERILDAVTELLAAGVAEDLTIAETARRAGVSEPTLYRHFGSRDRLYEALDLHLRDRLGPPAVPAGADGYAAMARAVFLHFAEHETLVRAALRSGLARKIRQKGKLRRDREAREALASHTRHLPENESDAVATVYRTLVSWETWDRITGELGVAPALAADTVAWAIEALNEKLEKDGKRERRTIRQDAEGGHDEREDHGRRRRRG